MNCCKFLLIFTTVFFGTFGQRLEPNLVNKSIVDGKGELDNYGFDSHDNLASDNDINDDEENNVVVLKESGEKVDIELLDGELKFQFCTKGCIYQRVSVCYDAAMGKYNNRANGECGLPGRCEFLAGTKRAHGLNMLWFMVEIPAVSFNDKTCGYAPMKFPSTTVEVSNDWFFGIYSCDPLMHDTNVVTLYVREASEYCPLKVIGAKRWYPPTPEILNVTTLMSLPESTESPKDDDNNQGVWIAVGIIGGILILAILAGLGYLFYRIRKQKKDAAKNIPTMPPKIIDAPPMPVLKQEEEPVKTATKEPPKIETKETKMVKDKLMKTKEQKEIVAETAAAAPKPNLIKEKTNDQKSVAPVAPAKQRKVEQIQKETPSNEKIANNPVIKDTVPNQKSSPIASVLDKRPVAIHPKKPYVPIYKSYSKSRQTDSLSENEK